MSSFIAFFNSRRILGRTFYFFKEKAPSFKAYNKFRPRSNNFIIPCLGKETADIIDLQISGSLAFLK